MNTRYKSLIALCAMLMTILTGCTNEAETTEQAQTGKLQFCITDAGMQQRTGSRAGIDTKTMTTTFEEGDKAGVFGVRNGEIVIDNLQLTYNINGFWDAPEAIDYTDDLAGVTFYGYYPYDETMDIDPAAQDPFAATVAEITPEKNQATKALFNKNDIMTSGATKADQKLHNVTMALSHRKAMINVELPNVYYSFTNKDLSTYVIAKAENASFTLGGETVSPFFDEESQSYFLIVEPNTTDQFKVAFTSVGKEKEATVDNLSQINEGQYANFKVDGGAQQIEHTLALGDYYCSDGYIFGSSTTVSEGMISNPYTGKDTKVIGVVYMLGTNEEMASKSSSWTHGYVLSTSQTANSKWGSTNCASYAVDWYSQYGLTDSGKGGFKLTATFSQIGYSASKAWESVPNPVTINGNEVSVNDIMLDRIATQRNDYPAPSSISSGWYIPGMWDWVNIYNSAASGAVADAMTACGGTAYVASTVYWVSEIGLNSSKVYPYRFQASNATAFARSNGTDSRAFRYILAF